MKLRSYWLPWALAAMVVFGYGGAARAQVPTPASTPGSTNPPGWKPHVARPFGPGHLTPGQEMRPRTGSGGIPVGSTPPSIVPVSPEQLQRAKEYSRKHIHVGVVPPDDWSKPQPVGATPPSIIPASPEQLRRAEEYSRKHGHTVFAPPHVDKRWGTSNGAPPEWYHRTAPPTPPAAD